MGPEIPRPESDGGPPKPDFYELMLGRALAPKELEALEQGRLILTIEDEDIGDVINRLIEQSPEALLSNNSILGITIAHAIDPRGHVVAFMQDHHEGIYKREDTDA